LNQNAAQPPGPARPKQILLLDPDVSVRESLAVALRTENHCVILAGDDQEALNEVAHRPIDLAVICVSGGADARWQVVRRLDAANPRLPIILLTATLDGVQHPMAGRAQARFQKPLLDLPQLFEKVTELTVQNCATG